MEAPPAETRWPALRRPARFLLPVVLLVEGFILGQTGIPVEDGGEILTVGTLGGTCHPSGMPLLALLARTACSMAGESGLRMLFAAFSALGLWALFRRSGLPGALTAVSVLALPAFRERLLQWDAYGLLFLAGAVILSSRKLDSIGAGYITGLAAAVHPQGLLLVTGANPRDRSVIGFAAALVLGATLYLALPLLSAAGAAVDWGNPRRIDLLLRQVSAAGYLERYGGSMGLSGLGSVPGHLRMLGSAVWPALILPAAVGLIDLARWNRRLLLRLSALLLADALFVALVNPMAAGSSQTGWMSLLAIAAVCADSLEALPRRFGMLLSLAVALSAAPWAGRQVLPDQSGDVRSFLSSRPSDAILFLSDNDLLYGGWVTEYCRDLRPDLALLSTGNFSAWFEALACRYDRGLDLSGSLYDVGGPSIGRDSAAAALIELTGRDNPRRRVIVE
jgi:hypothetical protein